MSQTSALTNDEMLSQKQLTKPKVVWAFGGGKGGIGKSFLCSNLAICVSQLGHKVTVVDLDLGGANLHTILGGPIPQATLSDFISQRMPHLESLLVETDIKNLNYISGANDALNIASINSTNKDKILKSLKVLPSDHIFLDLGAGTSELTMDFFSAADHGIVVTTPEPTSIENAYRFIKTAFFKRLKASEKGLGIHHIIEEAMDHKNRLGIRTPSDLIRYVLSSNPAIGKQLKENIESFHIKLIINQVRSRRDSELGYSMKSVCQKYFGIKLDVIGCIDFDNAAWQSLRKRQPLVLASPFCPVASTLFKTAKHLLNPKQNMFLAK